MFQFFLAKVGNDLSVVLKMSKVLAKNISFLISRQPKYLFANATIAVRNATDWVPKEKVTHTGQVRDPFVAAVV